jgi:parallel beta-helix repeat protein
MNRTLYPSVLLTLTLAACGGGGGGSEGISSDGTVSVSDSATATPSRTSAVTTTNTSATTTPVATAEIEASVPSPTTTGVLPIPTNIANGSTVNLQCGQTYHGTLELDGKSDITVRTEGTCGKASITPGSAISGWTHHQGDIYSAPIGFAPVQVSVAGKPVDAAHWPNRPQMWATNPGEVPNSDLDGATLVYLANQSVAQTTTISGNSVNTPHWFYVEGKLWMLDSPGEWAVSDDRLYMWAPDGQSPEGRVWAASDSNGISADYSTGITIDGVKVFSAANGISANTSTNLRVLNSEILNSARDGIWASGSTGLTVDRSTVANSVRNGVNGAYAIHGATVTNSTVANTGTVGRSKPTDAGIMFGGGGGNRIDNVEVSNSSYHGINLMQSKNTSVTNSVIDVACIGLTDCGGIYINAPDQQPLAQRIEGNTVKSAKGSEGVGIYLDGWSNGVTVARNTISNNDEGMLLHNAFDNVIVDNTFISNSDAHITFRQDIGEIRNNRVSGNSFTSTSGEQTFRLEAGPNLRTFATFDNNTYTSNNPNEFARLWDGGPAGMTNNFSAWKSWLGQEANSTMNGAQ